MACEPWVCRASWASGGSFAQPVRRGACRWFVQRCEQRKLFAAATGLRPLDHLPDAIFLGVCLFVVDDLTSTRRRDERGCLALATCSNQLLPCEDAADVLDKALRDSRQLILGNIDARHAAHPGHVLQVKRVWQ